MAGLILVAIFGGLFFLMGYKIGYADGVEDEYHEGMDNREE